MAEHGGTLKDLFVDQLQDLYWAENHSLKIWPKVASAATNDDLQQAFDAHLGKTHRHVERLNRVFEVLGMQAKGVKCQAMEGLVREVEDSLADYSDPAVRDVALITSVQRMEHYEMAGYGTVRDYAEILGYDDAASILQETLDDEGEHDQMLTKLAQGGFLSKGLNKQAV